MSIISNQPDGPKSDKNALPFMVNDAMRAALRKGLSTYITWITVDWAMRMCGRTYCPCVLVAIDESQKYIAQIDDADLDELLWSMFATINA